MKQAIALVFIAFILLCSAVSLQPLVREASAASLSPAIRKVNCASPPARYVQLTTPYNTVTTCYAKTGSGEETIELSEETGNVNKVKSVGYSGVFVSTTYDIETYKVVPKRMLPFGPGDEVRFELLTVGEVPSYITIYAGPAS